MKKLVDCVPTLCYNDSVKVVVDMAIENKDSVREYHKQLKDMKIRFPKANEELGIPDYSAIIKEQASKLGKSANEYILDLIEYDVRFNPDGIYDSEFEIIKDMKSAKSLKDK